jgi:CheY-like chemotaxis protein/DNA-binding XRE family transcriptional regulator
MPKIDFKKRFGASVRGWRNQLGISQEELAERASLHRTYISDVERGSRNVSLENIERLAQALDVSVPALFPQTNLGEMPPPASRKAGGKISLVDVLLVEDNPDDVELTLRAFKKARFANRVQVVGDGANALDYVFCRGEYSQRRTDEHPQIILLDLDLPKVSGLEVLNRIKTDQRTCKIPVVILTVSDDNYNMIECRRLGADNYIVKPVSFQGLSQATPDLNLHWALLKT